MRCEICDRDSLDVWYAERRAGNYTSGGGRGWVVSFTPGPSYPSILDFIREAAGRELLCYRIGTCGSAVCMRRAEANGVPGATYAQFREVA